MEKPRRAGPGRPTRVLRWLLGLPVGLYRLGLGWLLGERFLLLVQRGRRTGQVHRVVLEVIGRGATGDEYLVVAGWGRTTQWSLNLEAGGGIEVQVGRRRFEPAWRRLAEDEAAVALAGYERRNRLIGPLVRLVLGRLLGWRYDGSDEARRRAVRQLGVIGLRPAHDLRARPQHAS